MRQDLARDGGRRDAQSVLDDGSGSVLLRQQYHGHDPEYDGDSSVDCGQREMEASFIPSLRVRARIHLGNCLLHDSAQNLRASDVEVRGWQEFQSKNMG